MRRQLNSDRTMTIATRSPAIVTNTTKLGVLQSIEKNTDQTYRLPVLARVHNAGRVDGILQHEARPSRAVFRMCPLTLIAYSHNYTALYIVMTDAKWIDYVRCAGKASTICRILYVRYQTSELTNKTSWCGSTEQRERMDDDAELLFERSAQRPSWLDRVPEMSRDMSTEMN